MSLAVVHSYYYGCFVTVNTSTANNIFYLLSTMTKTQLHEEYSKTMKEAQDASGRREMMDLFKKANSIKKRLYNVDSPYPLIHEDHDWRK